MAPWSSQLRTAEGRSDPPKSVNIFVGFFLVLNTCIAFGFLGIPYVFFYSGFVTSIITLLIIALTTWSSATWEVETMARAEAVVAFRQSLREVGSTHQTTTGDKDEMEGNEEGEFEDVNNSVLMSPEFCSLENMYPNFLIRLARSFEPSELCEIFFNRWVKYLYVLMMIIYCSLGYWATSTVIGSAWATNIPFNFDTVKQCKSDAFQHHILPTDEECVNAYRLCLLIYGLIVVTLSLIDLKDQAIFQMLLGFMRFVMIGAIVIYCIVSLIEGGNACIGTDSYSNSSSSSNHTGNLSWSNVTNTTGYFDFTNDFLLKFDWKGWVVSIPVFTFAFIIHQAVPTVTQPIKQKQYLHWLMTSLFAVTTAAYLSVGIFVSLWFRGSVQETASLNWVTLSKPGHSPQLLRALSYFIVLFPTLDICTSSPLVIHALANNIYAVLQDATSRTKHKFEWMIRPILRLILAVIPLFPALFISNLVYVVGYSGLSGFVICFLFPTVLQLQSQRVCKKLFGDSYQMKRSEHQPCEQGKNCTKITSEETVPLLSVQRKAVLDSKQLYMTPYSNKVFSHPVAVVILGTLGVILFLLGIVSLFVKPDTLHCQAN